MKNKEHIDQRVLAKLRKRTGIEQEDMGDEELIAMTTDTGLRAFIDLDIAFSDLKMAVKQVISNDWQRMRRFFQRGA